MTGAMLLPEFDHEMAGARGPARRAYSACAMASRKARP